MKTRSKSTNPTTREKRTAAPEAATQSRVLAKRRKPTKSKRKPLGEDPRKPKKPPTAFFYFLEDFRKTFQLENPNIKSMRDIGKACGEKWKTMSFEEKVAYYDIATEKRAEFETTMAKYIKKKESGDTSEESDDYE
ncbi:high mobility group B protein 14 [Typha angustifolia]|uniref:high mobility group B protein 14 n=1 Tax=Typha angustifolia TaxID=59011 RepID=UPI003C2F629F